MYSASVEGTSSGFLWGSFIVGAAYMNKMLCEYLSLVIGVDHIRGIWGHRRTIVYILYGGDMQIYSAASDVISAKFSKFFFKHYVITQPEYERWCHQPPGTIRLGFFYRLVWSRFSAMCIFKIKNTCSVIRHTPGNIGIDSNIYIISPTTNAYIVARKFGIGIK